MGLWPKTPQCEAGTRIDPPMSEPISTGVIAEARAAADPPDEPPGVLIESHGLLVVPYCSLYVCTSEAPAGVLV